MPQPFDYTLKVESPGEAFLKAVQVGQQQQQVEAQRIKAETDRDKLQRQGNFQTDVAVWVKNPTPEGYREIAAKYPDYIQELSGVQKAVGDVDRPVIRNLAQNALMAHRNKNPEMVSTLIDQRIAAAADNPALMQKLQDMKSVYQSYSSNPKLQESLIVSALAQDEEGSRIYEKAFKETEPYETVPGVGIVLRSDIDRAVAAAEKSGSPDVSVKPIIPADAEADLKAGRVSPQAFDKVFGPNSSSKVLGMGGGQPTSASRNITEREANRIRASLGPKGFTEWLRANNIAIVGK